MRRSEKMKAIIDSVMSKTPAGFAFKSRASKMIDKTMTTQLIRPTAMVAD
jgi:hypothetical protein